MRGLSFEGNFLHTRTHAQRSADGRQDGNQQLNDVLDDFFLAHSLKFQVSGFRFQVSGEDERQKVSTNT